MYKSPIELICQGIGYEVDKGILKAVLEHGINVDKDELIRALQYDRDQYNKGYSDGKKAAMDEVVRCKDCKERFKAEFYQLEIRIAKLDGMLNKWLIGELEFEPTCSFDILSQQLRHMKDYSRFLRIRAEIEGVQL